MSNLIEEAIREHWGERCPDFDPGCPCCRAWADFDQLSEKAGDWQAMRDKRDMCLGNCDGLMFEIECCEHEAQKQAAFIHDQNKYIDWLKADRAKLRAALEEIAGLGVVCASDIAVVALRDARAALEGRT